MEKIRLVVEPYLKYLLSVCLVAYCIWSVKQIDRIRDTYPSTYVSQVEYQGDKEDREKELDRVISNHETNIKELKTSITTLRSSQDILTKAMYEGFKDTQKLILEKDS